MSAELSWQPFAARYARLKAPLAPTDADVARLCKAIAGCEGEVLLLGATPALAGLGQRLLAVDHSADVLRRLWPGDTPTRKAVQADWRALPFGSDRFDAVVGDGAISSFDAPPDALLAELRRVLRPGGVVALRCFCAPEEVESTAALCATPDADGGGIDALKWRIAMQLAAADPDHAVAARAILERFDILFPDRRALLARTGWNAADLVSVDGYAGTRHRLRFLPRPVLLEHCARHFGSVQALASEGYPLAGRCPVLVLRA